MSDLAKAPPVAVAPVKKSWVDGFVEKAKGEVKASVPSSVKKASMTVGSVALENVEGAVIGGLIGAARATFGVDASPAVIAAGTLVGIFAAESHPMLAEAASRASGQAAAILADRKAEKFLGGGGGSSARVNGGPGLKPLGAPGAKVSGEDDPILKKFAEVRARGQGPGGQGSQR